jgi:hypothetical protein
MLYLAPAASMRRRLVLVLLFCLGLAGCQSTGLVVESVNKYSSTYGAGSDLSNSIANGDGFIRAMTPEGTVWHMIHRYTDGTVWDSDFLETADSSNFDPPRTGIAYYTGHGLTTPYDEVPTRRCTSSSQCTNPPSGASLPGVCKAAGAPNYAPGDTPRCVYYSDRILAVNGSNDSFGHIVNYSNGGAVWGESGDAGAWRRAGTDGGANLVVLDASFGVLATYWVRQTQQAMGGAHMLATIMPVTGDTANVSDRGGLFGGSWAANPNGAVSSAWLTTMNSIAGSGINGGGCNFVIAFDATPAAAQAHINEDWSQLRDDSRDAKGASYYAARWLCNWPSSIRDQSIFELK